MEIKDIKRDKSNYKTIKSENDIDEIIDALTTFYRTEALRAENGE